MTRSSLRLSSLPTRLALVAALSVGLLGLGASLQLAARVTGVGFFEGLSPESARKRICAVPLERAIETSMAPHIPAPTDRAALLGWIRAGAPLQGFYEGPGQVIADRCGPCHGAQAGPQAGIRLETFDDAQSLARPGGRDPYRRTGKLHVHLFAVGALLSLLALGLGRTRFSPWLASALGLVPIGALLLSVPLTLGACQLSFGPWAIWALDGVMVLGWILGTGFLAWDLFAPLGAGGAEGAEGVEEAGPSGPRS